jgi:hypothetical protein
MARILHARQSIIPRSNAESMSQKAQPLVQISYGKFLGADVDKPHADGYKAASTAPPPGKSQQGASVSQ